CGTQGIPQTARLPQNSQAHGLHLQGGGCARPPESIDRRRRGEETRGFGGEINACWHSVIECTGIYWFLVRVGGLSARASTLLESDFDLRLPQGEVPTFQGWVCAPNTG